MCQRGLLGQSLLATFLHHLVNSLHMHLPRLWPEPILFCATQKHPMLVSLLLLVLYIGISGAPSMYHLLASQISQDCFLRLFITGNSFMVGIGLQISQRTNEGLETD